MRGRVLVVRAIAQPCVVEGALCAVIEDEHGAVHNLRVYNVEYTDARNVLPFGVPLAIKEPYCEAAMEDTSGVRVDHPSDLVYLSEGDPHYPENWRTTFPDDLPCSPSEKLKDEGNECFKKGLYREAICKYTAALRRDPSQALKTSILLNRSQSHLLLGSYAKAVADAEEIINAPGDQPNEKALFRGARALYALSRYDKAQTFLEQLTSAFPQNKDAKVLLAKTEIRLAEQQFGKYDWVLLISEARNPTPRAEAADYMGPIGLCDKGFLTAKNDIKAGELLLCHKAVAVLYPPEMKDEKSMLIYDTVKGTLGRGEGLKLTQKVVDRVSHDPTLRESVYSLAKGLKIYDTISYDTQAQEVDGESIVDIHILDTIRETYAEPFPVLHPVVPVSKPPAQGLGLWPLGTTAHLAHSCLPNACRSFIGDVLVLRACRDITGGETISIAYVHPTLPLEERRAVLGRTPGTSCTCKFCEIEEKEGTAIRQQRVDLLQKVKEISERAPAETLRTDAGRDQSNAPDETVVRQVVKEVLEICDQLEATFTHPTYEQPRFPLLEPLAYLFACYLYLGPNSTEDALKVNARYLTSLGFSFEYDSAPDAGNEKSGGGDVRVVQHGFYHPFIVRALVQQSSVCWQLGKRRTADAWRRIAENSMEIITGHRKLFRDGYSKVYESLKWEL
ncbi:uncharacterized protein FOMMEDRAFT_100608 [Fomitiporia mediterranea MF3/22]|uniref:uncharacterized protein n=1 Tax=Fomitiporia mediterranea (strain MF3/22) TaxID=694068 RepID=UPI0004407ABF|nr:uncharacterized protein FOMMEDRAFT_100608 [Fomitiporia mediterranea MF3/22]EJD07405.1 hypothetical protein FOMMEDRAFT_100608 [Fomitiporia mediterranea MF3/22]